MSYKQYNNKYNKNKNNNKNNKNKKNCGFSSVINYSANRAIIKNIEMRLYDYKGNFAVEFNYLQRKN